MNELFKLSVSKTSTFKSCKAKYKFSYIQKLPRKEYAYHIFGRFVHKILEDFHFKYINGSEEPFDKALSECFNDTFRSQEFNGKISQENKKEAFQIFTQYLGILNQNKNKIKNVVAVEKEFYLEVNDKLILNGMIDRVQLDDDGIYHICDYKTTKLKSYLKNDTLQLLTYAYVLLREKPEIKKIRASYILLRHNFEYITKEFSLEQIKEVKNIYENHAHNMLSEKEFEPNPTKLCSYCEYIDLCLSGKNFVSEQFKTGEMKYT